MSADSEARHPAAQLPVDARRADQRPLVEVPPRRVRDERLALVAAEAAVGSDQLLERDHLVRPRVVAPDGDEVAGVLEPRDTANALRGVGAVDGERVQPDNPVLLDVVRAGDSDCPDAGGRAHDDRADSRMTDERFDESRVAGFDVLAGHLSRCRREVHQAEVA
jgi:hypothetical protein